MAAPEHIIAAPYTLYVAPVGTAFPDIKDAPGVFNPLWFKIGTSGDKDYDEAGVTVSHSQTQNVFRGAGATAPRKAFRTEEDLTVGLTLADLSPEQYAKSLNDAAITTVAAASGVAGQKHFLLWRGLQVKQFALFVRGMSTVNNDLNAQYEVATAIEDASQAPVYTKGNPAMLALQYRALDANGDGVGFGRLRIQTAAPLP